MDKDRILKELKKAFSDKKVSNLMAIALVLAFVYLAMNVFMPNLFKNNKKNSEIVTEEKVNSESSTSSNYEQEQKKELETMLKSIEGISDVTVMITFESGEEKVPAYDNTTQNSVTEEKDTSGGTRINNQETENSKVVMSSISGDSEPFITKTNKPKVIGVMVSAKGAENSKIKYEIEKSVSSMFNISCDKVHVYPKG